MTLLGKLISLNIGMPVTVPHGSKEVETGIFKKPAGKPLYLTAAGLPGDGQADLINHGGPDKAVCVYTNAHFPYWAAKWGQIARNGAFGENFTVSELTEQSLCIGDTVRVGEALLQVSQPRKPCFKLRLKHNRPELPLQVEETGYTGFYFRVLQEGTVAEGDELILEQQHTAGITIAEANRVMNTDKKDVAGIKRLLGIPELAESWRETFISRLAKLEAGH